ARVAGGTGYEPSEWSSAQKIITKKTDIVGPIKSNGEINMGKTIRVSIGDDNLQEGTWKVTRGSTDITNLITKDSSYSVS
ncbi:hypothetical protein LI224_19160, partial [Erysipelatoclostridium ramosum]